MAKIEVTVQHKVGLHARPASQFVKLANKYPCTISVRNASMDGKAVNAKSILSVLTLGVQQGHTVEIEADGERAGDALDALRQLVLDNFGEA
jgi:phosphotransferase system HPr (HPr) family protein